MLLLGHKDYYDSFVSVAGIDKSIVYNRKLKIFVLAGRATITSQYSSLRDHFDADVDVNQLFSSCITKAYGLSRNDNYVYGLMYFCGKFYPYAFSSNVSTISYFAHEASRNNMSIAKYLDSIRLDPLKFIVTPDDIPRYENTINVGKNKISKNIEYAVFNIDDRALKPVKDFLIANKVCICNFMSTRSFMGDATLCCVEIDSVLSDYKFYRTKHMAQAYQELMQYISNELADTMELDPAPLTEKESLMRHGFNKMSFKKCKQGK